VGRTLGYMLTWTTYGIWLQGDERGFVRDGKILRGNKGLAQANKLSQVQGSVKLTKRQRELVREAILKEAALRKQRVHALAVKATHVHIVVQNTVEPIGNMVAYYKKAGRLAIKATRHTGKLWTRGYDKRFCFDEASLQARTKYAQRQNPASSDI